jgi:hypothetical protein
VGDKFAALGIHFQGIFPVLFYDQNGLTTAPDGWCSTGGGYTCGNSNLAINLPDITFDVPQTSVQMDIALSGPASASCVNVTFDKVTVNGGASSPITRPLTQADALVAPVCSSASLGPGQMCGRFQLSVGTVNATFQEVRVGVVCGPDQFLGGFVFVDNVSFTAPSSSQPVAVAVVKNAQGSPTSSFCSGDTAIFDGSGSTPKDGSLTYSWADVIDNPPLFSSPLTGVSPTLGIPILPFARSFSVQLTASDPFGLTATTSVPVFAKPNNSSPIAQAQPVPTVSSGSSVNLDGGQSFDPDGDPLSYAWVQTGGPTVVLTGANTATPSFTAPSVPYPNSTTLTFQLIVTDAPSSTQCGGPLSSPPATVNVTVEGINHPPIANAGAAQTVTSGAKVTLDASASTDPDRDAITYQWTQVAGTPVTLSNPAAASPQFIAPAEPPKQQEILTFQLVVTDQPAPGYTPLPSAPATVNITVQDPYAAPDCDNAVASLNRVWPPDRRLVGPLAIINTTDNTPGSVSITTTKIFQDEPTLGPGIGETQSPQATIMNDGTFFLRAARLGTGDGRVYHISFTAANGFGGSCSGEVKVCVPLTGGKGTTCVDQGALYNSTQ